MLEKIWMESLKSSILIPVHEYKSGVVVQTLKYYVSVDRLNEIITAIKSEVTDESTQTRHRSDQEVL
jgi:hypothetical protein